MVTTTFTVGGLSVINAIAGAYSENLPVICITGAACCKRSASLLSSTNLQEVRWRMTDSN